MRLAFEVESAEDFVSDDIGRRKIGRLELAFGKQNIWGKTQPVHELYMMTAVDTMVTLEKLVCSAKYN
jgi:hypothetical protein